ncbi:hypothetical protein GCM10010517_30980 [Streptosporangium fragile]|uniref:Uncharacterized protein n=1 Tax=Streptosporangium fragile TaxID=46186 RepID=A0ABN3VXH5_9ACTN
MTDLLLPGCDVPARRRVPDDMIAGCLVRMVDENLEDMARLPAVNACWMRGGAAASAAEWLISTPSSFGAGLTRVTAGARWAGQANRSEYLAGLCHVVATKGLPDELRHRAAAELVSQCLEAGYAEVRRLLPKNRWSWLLDVQGESWAGLITMEFIGDQTAPVKTRAAVAVEFVRHTCSTAFPEAVDELIRSPKAASADRLRLATAVARRVPEYGAIFLAELATDRTLQPLHRVQAAEELRLVDEITGNETLGVLADERQLPPAARELARRSLSVLPISGLGLGSQ